MRGKRFLSVIGAALFGTTAAWLYIQPNWSALITLIGALMAFVEAWRGSNEKPGDKVTPRFLIQALAALSVGGSIVWLILQPGFEPAATVLAGIFGFGGSFAAKDEPITQEMIREAILRISKTRPKLIHEIRKRWVDDALASALFQNIQIEIPTKYTSTHLEPAYLGILDAHDRSGGKLMVLGDPGAGKSIQMYVLIKNLLARAESDEEQPIPILFRLSSWAQKRQPLEKWLVDEVPPFYNMSKGLFQVWLSGSLFEFLLDGLDEVPEKLRDECIKEINAFMVKFPEVKVVVSSRKTEYEQTKNKIALNGSFMLENLQPEIIRAYLENGGDTTAILRKLLVSDETLLGFVGVPLNLDLTVRTFENMTDAEFPQFETVEKRREFLFDKYIDRMFNLREKRKPRVIASKKQTLFWLGWLAKRMKENNQVLFPVESIQPNWVRGFFSRAIYHLVAMFAFNVSGFASSVFVSLAFTLPITLIFTLLVTYSEAFSRDAFFGISGQEYVVFFLFLASFNLIFGVFIGVIGSLVYGTKWEVKFPERIRFNFLQGGIAGIRGLIVSLIALTGTWISLKIFIPPIRALTLYEYPGVVLIFAAFAAVLFIILGAILPAVLTGGLYFSFQHRSIRWDFATARQVVPIAMFTCLFAFVLVTLQGAYLEYTDFRLSLFFTGETITNNLMMGFFLGGILGGFNARDVDSNAKSSGRFGSSMRNSFGAFVLIFILINLVSGLLLFETVSESMGIQSNYTEATNLATHFLGTEIFSSALGLLFTWFFTMNNGGAAVIQHMILRVVLWAKGDIPRSYAKFLDDACDLAVLRRIGGAYEFFHPLLRDYIAQKKHSMLTFADMSHATSRKIEGEEAKKRSYN